MVHGKLKPAEKDQEMRRFVTAETKILVSTTVIDVGVNVPNASIMVIESAIGWAFPSPPILEECQEGRRRTICIC